SEHVPSHGHGVRGPARGQVVLNDEVSDGLDGLWRAGFHAESAFSPGESLLGATRGLQLLGDLQAGKAAAAQVGLPYLDKRVDVAARAQDVLDGPLRFPVSRCLLPRRRKLLAQPGEALLAEHVAVRRDVDSREVTAVQHAPGEKADESIRIRAAG